MLVRNRIMLKLKCDYMIVKIMFVLVKVGLVRNGIVGRLSVLSRLLMVFVGESIVDYRKLMMRVLIMYG